MQNPYILGYEQELKDINESVPQNLNIVTSCESSPCDSEDDDRIKS